MLKLWFGAKFVILSSCLLFLVILGVCVAWNRSWDNLVALYSHLLFLSFLELLEETGGGLSSEVVLVHFCSSPCWKPMLKPLGSGSRLCWAAHLWSYTSWAHSSPCSVVIQPHAISALCNFLLVCLPRINCSVRLFSAVHWKRLSFGPCVCHLCCDAERWCSWCIILHPYLQLLLQFSGELHLALLAGCSFCLFAP